MIKKVIEDQERIVEKLIIDNKDKFLSLYNILLEKQTINKKDFINVFNKKNKR